MNSTPAVAVQKQCRDAAAGTLTGNPETDLNEYVRLMMHELTYARKAVTVGRIDPAQAALRAARGYFAKAQRLVEAGV